MKGYFTVSCLFAISIAFANPGKQAKAYLIEGDTVPLFQRCLRTCHENNLVNQPVYLRNACQEKSPSCNDMIILNLDPPYTMRINDIAERILYADADVVHLRNTSTNTASHLYELLQQHYTHFIHVPCQGQGVFVANKHPLKHAEVIRIIHEDISYKDVLKFAILEDDICASVCTNDLSIQIVNPNSIDDSTITPILLVDVPATFSVVKQAKQQFSPFQLAERVDLFDRETFEIVPVRRGGDTNDKAGGYGGGRIDIEFGPGGTEWRASAFGGYEDNRGNYIELEVRRNEEGNTSASAEAGYDKDK